MYCTSLNARAARQACFAFAAWAGLAGAFFALMAQAQTPPTGKTSSTGAAAPLPQWDYLKMPPRGVPLRLGVLPPDVFKPHTIPGQGLTKICNRIWQDQTGSPERPFAVMYWGSSTFSDTVFYTGMIALDDFIVSTHSIFNRYAQAREYGKGDRG